MKNLFCFLFAFISLPAFARQAGMGCDSLIQKVTSFSLQYPQEKVYLHFDNTCYYLGDSIAYKAYVVQADGWQAACESRILYVDLLTSEGYLIKRNRHYLENGMCDGHVTLPDSLTAGYYEVRAYTAWMLNFGRVPNLFVRKIIKERPKVAGFYLPGQAEKYLCENPCIFSRVFPVYNQVTDGQYARKQMRVRPRVNYGRQARQKPKLQIAFYPEGGHLIEGQMSRIAYEVRNEEGRPMASAIRIRTRSGEILETLYPQHNGRGTMVVTPRMWQEGITTLRVTCVYREKEYEFKLPEVERSGVALCVEPSDKDLTCTVTPVHLDQDLAFTLQRNGKVIDARSLSSTQAAEIRFSCDTLEAGVHQFTVFDATGRIWADRLFFIYPRKQTARLDARLSGNLLPYQRNECSFTLCDDGGNPVPGATFSVSVRDGSFQDNLYSVGNIGTYLLLSSEIKGCIEEPEYYFNPQNEHRMRDLDVLMMVQGWRRYDWERMAGVKPFEVYYQPEDKMQIKGSVYRRTTPKKWKREVFVRCQIHYPGYIYEGVQQTKNGDFAFDVIQLYGNYPMFLQVYKHEKDIKETFDCTEMDNVIYGHAAKEHYIYKERVLPPLPKQFAFSETHEKEWSLGYDTLRQDLIGEVTVKDTRSHRLDPRYPNVTYEVTELCDFLNDIGYITGSVWDASDLMFHMATFCTFDRSTTVLSMMKDGDIEDFHRSWELDMTEGGSIDESPRRRNRALAFRFSNLKTVSYYSDYTDRKRFLDYLKGYPPATQVYFNYDLYHAKRVPALVGEKCIFYGYTPKVRYYSPDYSRSLPPQPDYRRTLYWNPTVTTDNLGHASIHYYNNGVSKKHILSAEGITPDGRPFYLNQDQ